ncbi:MAG: FAD-binding protein [Coriobacteriales bacterium]|nr:FAD-binding protein [Coriobacteriales bacterium]
MSITNTAVTRRDLVKAAGIAAGAAAVGMAVTASAAPVTSAEAAEAKAFVPGTYEGAGQGKNSVVKVAVTVDEHAITGIEILSHNESDVLSDNALNILPLKIMALQSTDIDAVSGATLTSAAVLYAVDEALEAAGGAGALVANPDGIDAVEQNMVPGTYTGQAIGCWMPGSIEGQRFGAAQELLPVEVKVTVDQTSILDVEVTTCTDVPTFANPVIERIPAAIVEQQSLFVDAVSGATRTSAAVLSATAQALLEAGANLAGFTKTKPRLDATEEYETDICIVGGGHSGTTAALVGTLEGRKVLILEKSGRLGGKGFCSGGISAAGSKVAAEAGLDITPDDFYQSLYGQSGGRANSLLLKTITAESGKTVDLLCECGFPFKAPNADTTWDNEFNHSSGKGQEKFDNLYANYILPNGGSYLLETRAQSLITEDGRVVGVEAKKQDGTKVIVHAKAVIVATGGFGGNPALLRRFLFNDQFYDRGLTTMCSGDGILMCEAIGAQLGPEIMPHMQEFGANFGFDFTANYIKYITYAGFLQVNSEGLRFMDESRCISDPMGYGCAALRVQGYYYIIMTQGMVDELIEKGVDGYYNGELATYFDTAIMGRAITPLPTLQDNLNLTIEKGLAWKAETPEELAQMIGFTDPSVFVDQFNRYNELCAEGLDADFGKIPQMMRPYEGTLYAVRMAIPIMGTLGGVKINQRIEAVDTNEKPIPGLYVAGQEGAGFFAYPYYETKCSTSTNAYTTGRLAALNASAYIDTL